MITEQRQLEIALTVMRRLGAETAWLTPQSEARRYELSAERSEQAAK